MARTHVRRPSELELEKLALAEEFKHRKMAVPEDRGLTALARDKIETRRERMDRSERFLQRQGWGYRPFVQLLQ